MGFLSFLGFFSLGCKWGGGSGKGKIGEVGVGRVRSGRWEWKG